MKISPLLLKLTCLTVQKQVQENQSFLQRKTLASLLSEENWPLKHVMLPSLNCDHEMLSLSPIHGNSESVHCEPSLPSTYCLLNQNLIYWKASCM